MRALPRTLEVTGALGENTQYWTIQFWALKGNLWPPCKRLGWGVATQAKPKLSQRDHEGPWTVSIFKVKAVGPVLRIPLLTVSNPRKRHPESFHQNRSASGRSQDSAALTGSLLPSVTVSCPCCLVDSHAGFTPIQWSSLQLCPKLYP